MAAEIFLRLFSGYNPNLVTKYLEPPAKRPFGLEDSFLSSGISLPQASTWPALIGGTEQTQQSFPLAAAALGLQAILTPAMNQNGIMNNL